MTVEELADVMGVEIVIRRNDGQKNRWTCQFEHTEIKDDKDSSVLGLRYGKSNTPQAAMADYVRRIRGKWAVVNAMSKSERREFGIPDTLECFDLGG